jgi:hypothetical protein
MEIMYLKIEKKVTRRKLNLVEERLQHKFQEFKDIIFFLFFTKCNIELSNITFIYNI